MKLRKFRETDKYPLCHQPDNTRHQNLVEWQAFLEGCLSIEWWTHASTDYRCKLLHKNDVSNKIMNLDNIDCNIRGIIACGYTYIVSTQTKHI